MTPQEKRRAIKKTVDQVIPPMEEIDTTKVLSDEEQAELARRFEEARTNKDLAKKLGREGLKSILKKQFAEASKVAERLSQKFEKREG
jgi:hypothetical protein